MCNKTCGDCEEFFKKSERCGNPMVYLNHGDNTYKVKDDTRACGFFYPIKVVNSTTQHP